jgi:flagellar biosynthesis protein FlhG
MARIITITSGKGGVGKTCLSLNLSLSLASQGFKVCLLDADLGMANVNILTGIYPDKDLGNVISGQFTLDEIIIKNYQGIDIIPGSSGIEQMTELSPTRTGTLISAFLELEDYDYFIFDTSAGISPQVVSFCMASHEIILVVTCEPTSLTDAYSMLKVLSKHKYSRPVRVVVNQVKSASNAKKAYARLKKTTEKFLKINMKPLGIVASDKNVRAAVVAQTPFFMIFPDTPASRCISALTARLTGAPGTGADVPLEIFWDRCLSFMHRYSNPQKNAEPSEKQEEKPCSASEYTRLKDSLASIESKLSILAKEMAELRTMVTNIAHHTGRAATISDPEPELSPPEPEKIHLDFESWLGRHNPDRTDTTAVQ